MEIIDKEDKEIPFENTCYQRLCDIIICFVISLLTLRWDSNAGITSPEKCVTREWKSVSLNETGIFVKHFCLINFHKDFSRVLFSLTNHVCFEILIWH